MHLQHNKHYKYTAVLKNWAKGTSHAKKQSHAKGHFETRASKCRIKHEATKSAFNHCVFKLLFSTAKLLLALRSSYLSIPRVEVGDTNDTNYSHILCS